MRWPSLSNYSPDSLPPVDAQPILSVEAFRVEVGGEKDGGSKLSGLTLVGSGWHPALFRSEAEALVGPVGFVHPRVVITTSTDEIALNRLSRSALVDEVLCNAEHSEVVEPVSYTHLRAHET